MTGILVTIGTTVASILGTVAIIVAAVWALNKVGEIWRHRFDGFETAAKGYADRVAKKAVEDHERRIHCIVRWEESPVVEESKK